MSTYYFNYTGKFVFDDGYNTQYKLKVMGIKQYIEDSKMFTFFVKKNKSFEKLFSEECVLDVFKIEELFKKCVESNDDCKNINLLIYIASQVRVFQKKCREKKKEEKKTAMYEKDLLLNKEKVW